MIPRPQIESCRPGRLARSYDRGPEADESAMIAAHNARLAATVERERMARVGLIPLE